MRRIAPVILSCTALLLTAPSLAEDSVADGIKEKAKPILYALSLLGTPYKFGGNNPEKGVDCSGFVSHVYKQSANVSLPHSAKAISQNGETVKKEELKPGDLVFFNTLKRPFSHVGIYTGDGKFVHASSRREKEVTVSSLEDGYWAKRFSGARRLAKPE